MTASFFRGGGLVDHAPVLAISILLVLWSSVGQGRKAIMEGDIILGGLFPVHQKGVKAQCGAIFKDRGVQRLEAMLFALDKINRDPGLLKDIRLGAIVLDTCSSDSYALNQSLEFIRASINTVDVTAFECPGGQLPSLRFNSKAVTGVVGGSYSEVSLQVANLLRLFKIPQISPASTGTSLSDKTRYDFFARTVPPDTFQALALVDVVEKFNWSYVSLVSSEGQYGDSGATAFVKEARARNICIAAGEKVPHSATEDHFDAIYRNLLQKPSARGVVLFTRAEDAAGVLRAAMRTRKHFFTWVASDGWGKQDKLVEGLERAAEGAITVELQSAEISEFDDYMKSLTPQNNQRNPWFEEYWESVFACKLDRQSNASSGEPVCSPNLRLDESVGYQQESKVQFVVDAVYTFAHALDRVWRDRCRKRDYCPEMKNLDGSVLYLDYILNVSFTDLAGNQVKFDRQGDGLGRYTIYNYQRQENASTGHTHYYRVVGKWSDGLHLDLDDVRWPDDGPTSSVCSKPCSVGEVKIMQSGDVCCWICHRCLDWEFVEDEFTCRDCGPGNWPHTHKRSCFPLDEQYMRWGSLYAIVPIAIATLGILLTVWVILVLLKKNETPIVKASGRELSYLLLSGILCCYAMTFAMLAKPTPAICGLQRFGVGFSFAVIYSSLLTKTNRISRIFESARQSARRPEFTSPQSQLAIASVLISVQVIGTAAWFLLEPPGVRQHYPDGRRNQVILKCSIRDSSFLLSLLYNMFLITTCTVYAVKTRKIPENFNESKFIGFTMYTTCIIWLAFVPIYFGTGNSFEVQITTLCVSTSMSAYVALFCLFSPKVYIILFHPEKNVRKLTMNSTTYKRAPTSSTCATSLNQGNGKGSAPAAESEEVEEVKMSVHVTPSKEQTTDDKDSLASL